MTKSLSPLTTLSPNSTVWSVHVLNSELFSSTMVEHLESKWLQDIELNDHILTGNFIPKPRFEECVLQLLAFIKAVSPHYKNLPLYISKNSSYSKEDQWQQSSLSVSTLLTLIEPGELLCEAGLFTEQLILELQAHFQVLHRFKVHSQTNGESKDLLVLKPITNTHQIKLAADLQTYKSKTVGRISETSYMIDLFLRLEQKELSQPFIEITAQAGMGKSTFLQSMLPHAYKRKLHCIHIACVDFATLPLDMPIAQLLKQLFAVTRPLLDVPLFLQQLTSSEDERDQLKTHLVNWLDDSSAFVLYELLGYSLSNEEQSALSHYTPQSLWQLRSHLVRKWIDKLSQVKPLCLIIEDIHWADEELLLLLETLVMQHMAQYSFMVLMTSRPKQDLEKSRPQLSIYREQIFLHPLNLVESRELAEYLTRSRRLPWQVDSEEFAPSEWIEHCILQSEGHPLLLTQLLGQKPSKHTQKNTTDLTTLFLTTYTRLSAPTQKFLAFASCLGRTFKPKRIPFGADEEQKEWLKEAISAQLVIQDKQHGHFVHALLREAIYQMLPQERKQAYHLELAQHHQDLPSLYAEHLALAKDAQAVNAFLKAAELLKEQYQLHASLALYERALSYLSTPQERIDILCQQAWLFEQFGDGKSCLRRFDEAHQYREYLDDKTNWQVALGRLAALRLLGSLQKGEELVSYLEKELSNTSEDLPLFRARFAYFKGCIAFSQGELIACENAQQEAIKLIESLENRDHSSIALVYAQAWSGMGDALYAQGRFAQAAHAMKTAIDLAQNYRFGRIEVSTGHMLAIVLTYLGKAELGLRQAENCHRLALTVSDTRATLFAELNMALPLFWAGKSAQAQSYCESAIKRVEWMGSSILTGMSKAFVAHILWHAMQFDQQLDQKSNKLPAKINIEEFAKTAVELSQQQATKLYGGVALGIFLQTAILTKEQQIAYIDQGLALLETTVVSHNYLYFTLGAVPNLVELGDHERLILLYETLIQFFDREKSLNTERSVENLDCVSMLLTWCSVLTKAVQTALISSDFVEQLALKQEYQKALLEHLSSIMKVTQVWSAQGIKIFEQKTALLISAIENTYDV